MRKQLIYILTAFSLVLILTLNAGAQTAPDGVWREVQKILASDGEAVDGLGVSVSISGDTAVVGACWDTNQNGTYAGAAYIFARNQGDPNSWGEVKKLTASDGGTSDLFGCSVSISGDTVIVGTGNDSSAYIFYRDEGGSNNWGQVRRIIPSDGAGNGFGNAVSISGDTVVVGAQYDNETGTWAGAAYIFYRDEDGTDNWGEVTKINASAGAAEDWLGISVSIDGDTAIVGAHGDDDNGNRTGAAYIFYRDQGSPDNWGQVQKLTASDGAAGDDFGWSVSVCGDTAIVGAYGKDETYNNDGVAYIFLRNDGGTDNWGEVKKIYASDGFVDAYFGRSLSINDDTVIVGADGDDDNGFRSGAAYFFSRDQGGLENWGEIQKLTAGDGASGDWLGYSVSISGDTTIVGAYQDDDNGHDSGSAYVFELLFVGDELSVDFGANGLWHYDGAWHKRTNWDPDDDLAGWSGGLGADFGTNGVWNHDGMSWSRLTTWDAGHAGLAGWSGGLAIDFNTNGLWNYDGSAWSKLTNWGPEGDMVGCLDGLWVDFSTEGLWHIDGSSWNRITTWSSGSAGMACWKGGLAVDFDASGLWNYNGSAWQKLTNWSPDDDMTGWPGGLAVDFGANGVWNLSGSSWSRLTTWDGGKMAGSFDGVAVDFDTNGMWKYNDSSWIKLTNWDAENMSDCDLN